MISSLRQFETDKKKQKSQEMKRIYKISSDRNLRKFASLFLGIENVEIDPKKSKEFLTSTEQLSDSDDPILKISKFYLAKALLNLGNYEQGVNKLQTLMEEGRLGGAWKQKALETLLRAHFQHTEYRQFLASYNKYRKTVARSHRDQKLVKFAALAYQDSEETKNFHMTLEELAARYPANDESRWAFKTLLKLSCEKTETKPEAKTKTVEDRTYFYSYKLMSKWGRNKTLDIGLKEFLLASVDNKFRMKTGKIRELEETEKIKYLFDTKNYPES